MTLSLFNPGATGAVVDVSLVSPTAGFVSPPAYQGIDVPGGSLVTENIGDHASDDPDVATEVTTLSGMVVADELQSTGQVASGGVTVVLGTPVPAPTWVFAQNTDVIGGTVTFHVLNPSSRVALVSVQIGLPQGAGAEPLLLRVPRARRPASSPRSRRGSRRTCPTRRASCPSGRWASWWTARSKHPPASPRRHPRTATSPVWRAAPATGCCPPWRPPGRAPGRSP